uniref:Bublin coiled-coil protein n=1 Tax=Cyprinus carpio carpio TaxID=630221 RepID=A0A9J7Z000_CYPCA
MRSNSTAVFSFTVICPCFTFELVWNSIIPKYAAIDSMLDQINSCLDNIEERNEALNGKLHELLESNREARREFREQLPPPPPDEEPESAEH